MATPNLEVVKAYLASGGITRSDADVTQALAAEQAAQARVCQIEADLPDDLAEALCRRVARNLAMRAVPLGVISDDMTSTAIGTNDPEIRRLEKPFRKLAVG